MQRLVVVSLIVGSAAFLAACPAPDHTFDPPPEGRIERVDGAPSDAPSGTSTTDAAPARKGDAVASDVSAVDSRRSDTTPVSRFVDLSVNRASATLLKGIVSLVTEIRVNPPGAFNGSGVGNKAIAGITGFAGLPVGRLPPLSFKATRLRGTERLYINMLVDLTCNNSEPKVLVYDAGSTIGPTAFDITKDAFKIVGNLDGKNKPSWLNTTTKLAKVTSAYPKACLADSASHDGGMPRNLRLRAVMLLLGHSATNTTNRIDLSSITVGGKPIR